MAARGIPAPSFPVAAAARGYWRRGTLLASYARIDAHCIRSLQLRPEDYGVVVLVCILPLYYRR